MFLTSWQIFCHHDVFLTSWQTFDIFLILWRTFGRHDLFYVMTNFLTSWQILTSWRLFDFMINFWSHDKPLDVMTCFWCNHELLTSWLFWRHDELFGVMTCFWFYVTSLCDILTNFVTSWRTFWLFKVMMDALRFDGITNFLTSWHVLTSWQTFWHHDVFLISWQTFDIFLSQDLFWMSWRTFVRHDELVDVMTKFWHFLK